MPHELVMEVARNEFMPQLAETLSERTWGWVWMVDTSTQALYVAKKKVEEVLDESGFKESRAAKMDINDLLK